MLIYKKVRMFLFFLCFIQMAFSQSLIKLNPKMLQVGDPAPPLTIQKWIKGRPLSRLDSGRYYLVEFGFIGCAFCQASIPHLTQLAKKYASQLTIIGVHIWENPDKDPHDLHYVKRVDQYVKNMGSKIGYSIAVDVPLQKTADDWMKASGREGAPASFIIGLDGKISWIGNPEDLNSVLPGMLETNTIPTVQRNKFEKETIDQQLLTFYKTKDRGDLKTALQQIDTLINSYPAKKWLYFEKFRVLLKWDHSAAMALAQWILQQDEKNPDFHPLLLTMSTELTDDPQPEYRLAMRCINRALTFSKENVNVIYDIYNAKARVYWIQKDCRNAVKYEQTALRLFKQVSYGSSEASFLQIQNSLMTRLARFEKGCSGG